MPEAAGNGKICKSPSCIFVGRRYRCPTAQPDGCLVGHTFPLNFQKSEISSVIVLITLKGQQRSKKGPIMKLAAFRIVILLIAGLALGACRAAPLYNVSSATMSTPPTATVEQVAGAIKRAGVGLGWQMIDKGPGEIEGRLKLRSHLAVVSVTFDNKNFSIFYKDSNNLDYDGTRIHKNYNGWIQNLENAILAQATGI
jgi:hypothetical protein